MWVNWLDGKIAPLFFSPSLFLPPFFPPLSSQSRVANFVARPRPTDRPRGRLTLREFLALILSQWLGWEEIHCHRPSRPRPRRPRPSLAAPPEPPFSLNGRYITRKQCHHRRRNSAVPEGRKFHRKGLRDSGFFLHVGEFTLWNRHEILVFRCC